MSNAVDENAETQAAWNSNAAFWDERMGEGNDFVNELIWPAVERMLPVTPGMQVLDVACGNGLTSRRLAEQGASVTGIDFSSEMIAHARRRSAGYGGRIAYQVIDATDEQALLALGERRFHAALSSMALFDMVEVEPLFRSLAHLLRPGGVFVFSLMHPCFNNPFTTLVAEAGISKDGDVTTYAVKVYRYMTSASAHGTALHNQPQAHVYFHRSLQTLLGSGFRNGFAVDALEERAFPPSDDPARNKPLSWGSAYSEIPPVMVVRMRLLAGG